LTQRDAAASVRAMGVDKLFSLASTAALVGWLALALAPVQRSTMVLVARFVAAILCGAYAVFLITGLVSGGGLPEGAGFSSLAGVRVLLASPQALLAGWVHYLAFDLFIGSWEAENAPASGVPHALLLVCLALTLFAGPVGLLLFLVIKAVRRK
jgi:hypothetical protein